MKMLTLSGGLVLAVVILGTLVGSRLLAPAGVAKEPQDGKDGIAAPAPQGQRDVPPTVVQSRPDKLRGGAVPLQGAVGAPNGFSPDGKRLVGGDGKNICVWDAATGKLLTMDPLKVAGGFTVSPDGKLLCISEPEGIIGLRFSPDGALLAGNPAGSALAGKPPAVVLRDARTGEVVHTLEGVEGDGHGEVMLWELSTGKALRPLEGSAAAATSATFSPDAKFVAGITHEDKVKLWDVATGKAVRSLGSSAQAHLAFSPDGRKVAGGGRIWDAATGKELLAIPTEMVAVAFSPDGKLLITAGTGPRVHKPGFLELYPVPFAGRVQVWDAETGKELLAFSTNQTGNLAWACVAPDGEHVLTNGGWDKHTMALWSLYADK